MSDFYYSGWNIDYERDSGVDMKLSRFQQFCRTVKKHSTREIPKSNPTKNL
jgi:hypothetical protein